MSLRYLPLGALLLAFVTGCNTSPKEPAPETAHEAHDHDHGHEHGEHAHDDHAGHDHGEHDHAEIKSFHEAVEMIETARDTIRDKLAAGETDKADEALHALGHTLEHVGELTGDYADDVRSEIKKDVEELLDLFGKVDEQIHAKQEVTYDTWSSKIDEVIGRLHDRAHEEPAKEAAPE